MTKTPKWFPLLQKLVCANDYMILYRRSNSVGKFKISFKKMSLNKVRLLDEDQLLSLLKEYGYCYIANILKGRNIDGKKLLEISEFQTKSWGLSLIQTKNLLCFIKEITDDPSIIIKSNPKVVKQSKNCLNEDAELYINIVPIRPKDDFKHKLGNILATNSVATSLTSLPYKSSKNDVNEQFPKPITPTEIIELVNPNIDDNKLKQKTKVNQLPKEIERDSNDGYLTPKMLEPIYCNGTTNTSFNFKELPKTSDVKRPNILSVEEMHLAEHFIKQQNKDSKESINTKIASDLSPSNETIKKGKKSASNQQADNTEEGRLKSPSCIFGTLGRFISKRSKFRSNCYNKSFSVEENIDKVCISNNIRNRPLPEIPKRKIHCSQFNLDDNGTEKHTYNINDEIKQYSQESPELIIKKKDPFDDSYCRLIDKEALKNREKNDIINDTFFVNTDREGAEKKLKGSPDGTFLFRPSQKYFLVITIKYKGKCYNLGITRTADNKLRLHADPHCTSPEFKTLQDFVDHFTKETVSFTDKDNTIVEILLRKDNYF